MIAPKGPHGVLFSFKRERKKYRMYAYTQEDVSCKTCLRPVDKYSIKTYVHKDSVSSLEQACLWLAKLYNIPATPYSIKISKSWIIYV